MGAFGDKFRQERERKKILLDDVSRVTKIAPRMLQAIEEEHFNLLPGGVFNKGFIRAYARHLGLDAEEAVDEYLACLRQAQIEASAALDAAAAAPVSAAKPHLQERPAPAQDEINLPELHLPREEDVVRRRPLYGDRNAIPWRAPAAVILLLVLGGIFWTRRSHNSAPRESVTPPPSSTPSSVAAAAPVPATQVPKPATAPPQPVSDSSRQMNAPQPATSATAAASTVLAANQTPLPTDDDPTPRPSHVVRATPEPPPKLTLVIRAAETSWIAITADGQPVVHETLIAPAHTSVRASREITVKTGNAAGVTFLWNGKEIPAQGAEAEVKTLVFDSNGMRVVPPAQPPDQPR